MCFQPMGVKYGTSRLQKKSPGTPPVILAGMKFTLAIQQTEATIGMMRFMYMLITQLLSHFLM